VIQQSEFDVLARGARMQLRVIGALMIRELQSRFGRHNIGFLWFLVEPLLLAGGVTVVTYNMHAQIPEGLHPLPFHIVGYIGYMQFRTNANRAAAVILSNRVLMYHRQVSITNIVVACTLLEFCATFGALIVLTSIFAWLGLSPIPERPLSLIFGMLLMWWYTMALAMIICALSQYSEAVDRLVHPITYLSLPFSGMLFRIDWLPPDLRELAQWLPLPQITEIIRQGVWGDLHSDYLHPFYIISQAAVLTFLGLLGLRVARHRVRFE